MYSVVTTLLEKGNIPQQVPFRGRNHCFSIKLWISLCNGKYPIQLNGSFLMLLLKDDLNWFKMVCAACELCTVDMTLFAIHHILCILNIMHYINYTYRYDLYYTYVWFVYFYIIGVCLISGFINFPVKLTRGNNLYNGTGASPEPY